MKNGWHLVIETAPEEDLIEENLASGLFLIWFIRPYFDLSNYKYQTIDLLKEYSTGITINQEELEEK
jgi:S-DNA-T family DNA segregation ATPase FtsK/SpoIIIE